LSTRASQGEEGWEKAGKEKRKGGRDAQPRSPDHRGISGTRAKKEQRHTEREIDKNGGKIKDRTSHSKLKEGKTRKEIEMKGEKRVSLRPSAGGNHQKGGGARDQEVAGIKKRTRPAFLRKGKK